MNNDYSIIYKKFAKYIPLNEMKGLQWFALENNYGESYGDIHKKYMFKKQAKLLNIGDGNVREMIEEKIDDVDWQLLNSLPYTIAYPLKQALSEKHYWSKINYLLNILPYLSLTQI